MVQLKQIVVIPARYQSSRLPGKPLVSLAGISMIRRTYHRCLQAFPAEDIYVASDHAKIIDHCQQASIKTILTPEAGLTGTDRIAEAAKIVDADIYINVQGDEPVINPEDILRVAALSRAHPSEIINGYCEISDEALFRSFSIPKVVLRPDKRLLYMSRSPIPITKGDTFQKSWRQICVYAFPRDALLTFGASESKSELEAIEDIEILRFLELGYDVRMIELSDDSIAVDTPEDIARAETAILERGLVDAG